MRPRGQFTISLNGAYVLALSMTSLSTCDDARVVFFSLSIELHRYLTLSLIQRAACFLCLCAVDAAAATLKWHFAYASQLISKRAHSLKTERIKCHTGTNTRAQTRSLFICHFSSHYSHLVIVPFDSHEWENLTYRRIHIRKCQTRWNEELTHSKREDKNRKINKTHFGIYRNVDEVTFLDFIHWLSVRGIWI